MPVVASNVPLCRCQDAAWLLLPCLALCILSFSAGAQHRWCNGAWTTSPCAEDALHMRRQRRRSGRLCRSRHSAAYRWLREHHAELVPLFTSQQPPWREITAELTAGGVRGGKGKALTGRALAGIWGRVCEDVAVAEAKRQATQQKARLHPSRLPADWRPTPVQPVAPRRTPPHPIPSLPRTRRAVTAMPACLRKRGRGWRTWTAGCSNTTTASGGGTGRKADLGSRCNTLLPSNISRPHPLSRGFPSSCLFVGTERGPVPAGAERERDVEPTVRLLAPGHLISAFGPKRDPGAGTVALRCNIELWTREAPSLHKR